MQSRKRPAAAVNIVPANGDEPLPVEIIEQAIVDIAEGMQKLLSTRLTRKAIVTLLHASCGNSIGKGTIEIVLNNLELMEHHWLKPKRK
jgi:hypothetical protein